MDRVAYIGLFLLGKALEWFKPYLIEVQNNGIITTNKDVQYIFSSWAGFIDRLTQIFRNLEATTIAERKL
jgi:hypothetical protein